MKKFMRLYLAYGLIYLSFRTSLYLLNELFSMVDEIIDNNNNELIDDTNGLVTTHDSNTCKEVVNAINMRGGQNGLLLRGAVGVIQGLIQHVGKFCGKIVCIILKPIAKSIGFVLMKISVFQAIYKVIKTGRVIIASSVALATMILFARFDSWALILGDAIPLIEKSLIRLVNQDLQNTCENNNIPFNIKSHSFRINMVTNLLKITSVQNTADIIGHADIRSTMSYNRYSLSKIEIQNLLDQLEKKN